jgi:hypothetical protein
MRTGVSDLREFRRSQDDFVDVRVTLSPSSGKDPPGRARVAPERLDEIVAHFNLSFFPGLGCESFFGLCRYLQDLLLQIQILPAQVADLLFAKPRYTAG